MEVLCPNIGCLYVFNVIVSLILIILLTAKMIGATMVMVVFWIAIPGEPPCKKYFVPSNEVSFPYSSWIITISFDLMPYRSHLKEIWQGILQIHKELRSMDESPANNTQPPARRGVHHIHLDKLTLML